MIEATEETEVTNPIAVFNPAAEVPSLIQHSKREQWGLAIVLDKEDDRVHMQFQDGRKRTFKKGWYHLLNAVDRRLDVTLGIVDALQDMAGRKRRRSSKRTVTLDEQIAYFAEELFENGFRGEEYTAHHRGDGRKRPLKRHRDGLLALAEEKLGRRSMLKALTEGNPSDVHEAAGEVVASTDLVKVKERKTFLAMDAEHHAAFANALFAVLYGKAPLAKTFGGLVAALERGMGDTPTWELATLFLGVMKPKEHAVIRFNTHSRQATFMAPGLVMPDRPMGTLYERLLKMTLGVREALEEADLSPRDNLDVFDFMWATLRPNAQKAIRARAAKARKANGEGALDREAA